MGIVCAAVVVGGALGVGTGQDGGDRVAEDEQVASRGELTAIAGMLDSGSREVSLRAGGVVEGVALTWSVDGRPGEDLSHGLPSEPLRFEAEPGALVLFNVQNYEGVSSPISCEIRVDGIIVAFGEADGPGAMAACEGTAS